MIDLIDIDIMTSLIFFFKWKMKRKKSVKTMASFASVCYQRWHTQVIWTNNFLLQIFRKSGKVFKKNLPDKSSGKNFREKFRKNLQKKLSNFQVLRSRSKYMASNHQAFHWSRLVSRRRKNEKIRIALYEWTFIVNSFIFWTIHCCLIQSITLILIGMSDLLLDHNSCIWRLRQLLWWEFWIFPYFESFASEDWPLSSYFSSLSSQN